MSDKWLRAPSLARGLRARVWQAWVVLIASGLWSAACVEAQADASPQVQVRREGETIAIEASVDVPVSPREAWAVLSDYDHMTEFVPNLESSRVVSQPGEPLRVEQKKRSGFGPLRFSFTSVWEIENAPYQTIKSHTEGGEMKTIDGVIQLIPEHDGTRVNYHAVGIPNFWVPPGVGPAVIRSDISERLEAMRDEMLRRKRLSSGR